MTLPYTVNSTTGYIDYDMLAAKAMDFRPKLIKVGARIRGIGTARGLDPSRIDVVFFCFVGVGHPFSRSSSTFDNNNYVHWISIGEDILFALPEDPKEYSGLGSNNLEETFDNNEILE
ncbi:hypothetical protein GIB67_039039 [Kingdonia uniflora]|uniref:Uncharacterized protein n=1 Tax=Kingdonia uniflora TaxID=39325 RepID=A0A7J7LKS7_9MAGN|nr:hypothetical protein GIB67_039039 [Kingdonia uniflora]